MRYVIDASAVPERQSHPIHAELRRRCGGDRWRGPRRSTAVADVCRARHVHHDHRYRCEEDRVDQRGRHAVSRERRSRDAQARARERQALGDHAAGVGGRSRTLRGVHHRHAGRRAPQPELHRDPEDPRRLPQEYMRDGQVFVLRSTWCSPGTSARARSATSTITASTSRVAFCPERVAQGESLKEVPEPAAARSPRSTRTTLAQMRTLFSFAPELIELSFEPMEAELCKLMTNAWRYLQFATTNQFYMIAKDQGLDFERILHGCRHNYPAHGFGHARGLGAAPRARASSRTPCSSPRSARIAVRARPHARC